MPAEEIPTLEKQNLNNRRLIALDIEAAGTSGAAKAALSVLSKEYLELVWENSAQYQGFPELRRAYVKRDVLDFLVMTAIPQFDFKEADVEEEREQIMDNLQRAYDNVQDRIKTLITQGSGGRSAGAVGELSQLSPLPVPAPPVRIGDPNDPEYAGDARRRGLPFGRW